MSLQIIILNTSSQPDGSFSVSGVFWLTPPSNNIVPLPNFKSAVPFIDASNLSSLQYGNLVEQTFNSGLFAPGTDLADAQTAVQNQFNTTQTNLTNANSPLSGLIGNVFDGYSNAWSSTNPFLPISKVKIASQYTQRTYNWINWKAVEVVKGGQYQYDDDGTVYTIWFYDQPEVHLCTIWKGTVPNNVISGGYSQIQNNSDKSDFETNFKSLANAPIAPKLTDGRIRASSEKTNQSRITIYSPNWCDKTTWYQSSVYVSGETVSLNDSDGYYHLAHQFIIDSYHGKITLEDSLKDPASHSFRVSITIDGYAKTEQDPHYGTGGDYVIDYTNGIVKPLSWTPQDSDTFVATYHYAGSASFTILPTPGKQLLVNMAECQFSTDIVMNDTVTFQVLGYAGVFAPQLGYPYTTLIPLTSFKYKSMSDLYNDAVKAYPIYPPMGGNGWRGMQVSSTVLDWDYVSSTTVNSASGMQVIVSLDHNMPFGGTYATVTFYCTSE